LACEVVESMRDADSAFLSQLGDQLRPLVDPIEIQYEAARAIGLYLRASRVGYAEDLGDGEHVAVTRDYTDGVPSIEGVYTYVDYGADLVRQLRAGHTVVRADIARDASLTEAERTAHASLQLGATINVPLVKANQLVAILFLHYRDAHSSSLTERVLVEEVAQRVWSHVERAKVEVALRQSERLYRTLFETIDDGFQLARLELSPDGTPHDVRLLQVNQAWSRMTGMTAEAARGKLLWGELMPALEKVWLDQFARAVLTQQASRFESYAAPFARWLDGHIVPFAGPQSREFVTVFRDVSARRRVEQALRESEAKYRSLFDSIDEGYCIIEVLFDADDKPYDYGFIEINQAFERHTGLSAPNGRTIREIAPNHEQHWYDIYGRVARSGEPVRFQDRADALGRVYDVYAFRIGTPELPYVAVLFNDITERERVAQQLRDSDRRKDEFLAILGHELRNPLAAIHSAAELMKEVAAHDSRLLSAHSVLERQTAHMTRLIDGLLEVSRIARGKIQLELESVDAREIVKSVVHDRTARIDPRKLSVQLELGTEPLWVSADPVRLTQVIDNLVGNALKFTPDTGVIAVSARAEGALATLRVRDNGVGIRRELVARVFEPFEQDVQDIARGAGGLGLGLALAKGLVELHGGSIEVQSEGPGSGAEFIVRLSLVAAPAARLQPQAASGTPARQILIVEDNEDAAGMLSALLESRGHSVRVADSGSEALRMLREQTPEIVVCDIGLPGMSGYELASQLRRDPALRSLRLIALSGYGQPEDRRRSREAGFDDHLVKPVDFTALESILRGL
jgi:PAS domain S-box-containing protein